MSKKFKKSLREISKFLSGLILGDLLVLVWFFFNDSLPVSFVGITITERFASIGIVFDIVVLFLLIFFGWYQGTYTRKAKEYWFHYVAGVLLAITAALHLLGILFGWSLTLGDWSIPYWLNSIGALVTGFLAIVSFYLAKD